MHRAAGRLMASHPFDHSLALLHIPEGVLDRVDAIGKIVESAPAEGAGTDGDFRIQRAADDSAFVTQDGPERTGGGIGEFKNDTVDEDRCS